jgi:putative redox protein
MIRATSLEAAYQTDFTNGSHGSVADVPVEKGGSGQGFGPHDLVEAALATCITMTVKMYAARHGLPLEGAVCEVRIDRSRPDAAVLNYTLDLCGDLTDEQCRLLGEAASRCPVARTLTGAITIQPAPRT